MILEMTTAAFLFGAQPTRASSETARFIGQQSEYGRRRLQESYALGLVAKGVFEDLCRIMEQSGIANWDGYGAVPVTQETFNHVVRFLNALPLGTAAPSIGAEPDGQVTLEWYRSPRHLLSVSVTPHGELHYAALLGLRSIYGTEPFFGEVPIILLDIVHRVVSFPLRVKAA